MNGIIADSGSLLRLNDYSLLTVDILLALYCIRRG